MLEAFVLGVGCLVMLWLLLGFAGWVGLIALCYAARLPRLGELPSLLAALVIALGFGPFTLFVAIEEAVRVR